MRLRQVKPGIELVPRYFSSRSPHSESHLPRSDFRSLGRRIKSCFAWGNCEFRQIGTRRKKFQTPESAPEKVPISPVNGAEKNTSPAATAFFLLLSPCRRATAVRISRATGLRVTLVSRETGHLSGKPAGSMSRDPAGGRYLWLSEGIAIWPGGWSVSPPHLGQMQLSGTFDRFVSRSLGTDYPRVLSRRRTSAC